MFSTLKSRVYIFSTIFPYFFAKRKKNIHIKNEGQGVQFLRGK